jgi:hypothetical protein
MRATWMVLGLCACGRLEFSPLGTPPADYAYRKPITIDHAANVGGADLASFPLALRVTDSDLRTIGSGGRLATGFDFAFLDADAATPLAFEIDRFSADTGDLVAWVKLPVFSATADTRLYLAFGDPTVTTSREDRAAVWSEGYVGVWHFSEAGYAGTAGESADATGAHPGTAAMGATTTAGGKFGRAASLGGSCASISIDASAALQPSSVTVSAWALPMDLGSGADRIDTIVAQDYWRPSGTGSQGYYLEIYRTVTQPVPTFYAADGPGFAHAFSATPVANATWFYEVGTYDETTGDSQIYVDGAAQGVATMTGPIAYLSKPVSIGCVDPTAWWFGAIDEVRISNLARSPAWIATEYANQLDPSARVTVGPTE